MFPTPSMPNPVAGPVPAGMMFQRASRVSGPSPDFMRAQAEIAATSGTRPIVRATGNGGFNVVDHATGQVINEQQGFPSTPLAPAALPDIASLPTRGKGFFSRDGGWRDVLGIVGDTLSGNPIYFNSQMAKQRREQEQVDRKAMWQHQAQMLAEQRQYDENRPQFFMAGNDRVRYDPTTGLSSTVYDAPEPYQAYATQFGAEGSSEYQTAAQDFVLRGNGPTAFGYDAELEGVRQGNRERLEGVKQSNRLGLRTTPTYRDTHPRPTTARSGMGLGRAPTMAGTMAPLLGKVARGEALTPGEQQAWAMYRSGRGRGAGGGAGSGGSGALPPAAAISMLKKNPALAPQFDAKYGAGAAARYGR